jgi:cytochrome c oxidase subunit 4
MKSDVELEKEFSYRTCLLVWVALIMLLGMTVSATAMHLGRLSIYTSLFIALLKSGLVLSYFMHLRYEQGLFKVMFLVAVATLAVFIGFTFFDISYR